MKPTTFYNETGRSARALADFYKLSSAADILVLHDDLALPFGTIRTREKGSDAGNNGVKSLNAHLGPSYARIRIGIGSELRALMGDTDFVLAKFSQTERSDLNDILIPKVLNLVTEFATGNHSVTSISALSKVDEIGK